MSILNHESFCLIVRTLMFKIWLACLKTFRTNSKKTMALIARLIQKYNYAETPINAKAFP